LAFQGRHIEHDYNRPNFAQQASSAVDPMGKASREKRERLATIHLDELLDRSMAKPETWLWKMWQFVESPLFGLFAAVVLTLIGATAGYTIVLFPIAWAVGTAAIYRAHWFEEKRTNVASTSLCSLVLAGCLFLWWLHMPSSAPVPDALINAQLHELHSLNEFLVDKDENALRDLFTFPDTLHFNIKMVKRTIAPTRVTKEDSAKIDKYFVHGNGHVDLRFAQLVRTPQGLNVVKLIPNKVAIIATPAQYATSKNKLFTYESSSELPSSVRDAVRQFDRTVDDNLTLMFDVLNERLPEDPNNILLDHELESPYWHGTENAYWTRFMLLRPKADNIAIAIKTYLNIR
jgi:hypothetical protein